MCTNMFAWLLKILCQTFIAFDQNKIIYDKKKFCEEPYNYIFVRVYKKITHVIHNMLLHSPGLSDYHFFVE